MGSTVAAHPARVVDHDPTPHSAATLSKMQAHRPLARRGWRLIAGGSALALLAACTTESAPTAPAFTAIAAPTPSMTTLDAVAPALGATRLPEGPTASASRVSDGVRFPIPVGGAKEVAREVLDGHNRRYDGGVAVSATRPVHLLAQVRCTGLGGPTRATLLVTTETTSVLGAPNESRVLARREVLCNGRALSLDLGSKLRGAAGVTLVEPADEGLKGYVLLVKS